MKRLYILFLLFFVSPSKAIVVDNFTNMCGDNAYYNLGASFVPMQYMCTEGTFLPADTLGCVVCPKGATCSGGTFTFSESKAHGVTHDTPITQNQAKLCSITFANMKAVFEPSQYTCGAGMYLPANETECESCLSGSACTGGTFTFNETTDQGIVACDNGYHSSAGASSCTPNTITINWSGADAEDIIANNAGQCTYGGDIRTPVKAQHIAGKTFVGWTFDIVE